MYPFNADTYVYEEQIFPMQLSLLKTKSVGLVSVQHRYLTLCWPKTHWTYLICLW